MRRRFAPKKHVTQYGRVTALRMELIQRIGWPPSAQDIERMSRNLPADLVNIEIAAEDLRRASRG